MKYNQSGFRFSDGYVILSHNLNDVPLSFLIPATAHIPTKDVRQVEVFQDTKGQFWLSFAFSVSPTPVPYKDNGKYQAFDLGAIKHTAVNADGKFLEIFLKRPDRYWKPKIESVQSRRDHYTKFGRRWKRLNAKLNRMQRKSANQGRDFDHKQTKHLIKNTKANTLIVGDLNVKGLCQKNKYEKTLHTSLHNTGHISRFVGFLTYKAEKLGKKVTGINERGTSKTCCACGTQHKMPLSKRTMDCDCGNIIDRDRNSAVSIMMGFLSQNALWTRYRQFVDTLQNVEILMQEAPSERAG